MKSGSGYANPRHTEPRQKVDINHSHVFLTDAYASILEAAAKQDGFQPAGELSRYPASLISIENQAPTPKVTTARFTKLMKVVNMDIAALLVVS